MAAFFGDHPTLKVVFLEDLFEKVSRASRVEHAMLFLRLFIGAYFLYAGYQQYETPHFEDVLASVLDYWSTNTPLFWYHDITQVILIPLSSVLALALPWLQMLVGASLILGFLTQLTLPLALLLNLNILLAAQHTHPAVLGLNLTFMALGFALYWCQCGQYWGLDYWLFKPGNATGKKSGRKAKAKTTQKAQLRAVSGKSAAEKDALNLLSRKKNPKLTLVSSRFDELDDDDDDED